MRRFNKRAQNTLEYAVLIAVVAAGLLTMSVYVKRGFQGHIATQADDMGEQWSTSGVVNYSYSTGSTSRETYLDGVTRSDLTASEISNRTYNASFGAYDEEYFGDSGGGRTVEPTLPPGGGSSFPKR